MLPAPSRLRRSRDFTETVSRGARAGRATVVVHLDRGGEPPTVPSARPVPAGSAPGDPVRAGFVVSKAVGNSVTRHLVVRRLRALVAARLDRLPAGSRLVVRALPACATASTGQLAGDLDAALDRVLARSAGARGGETGLGGAGSKGERRWQ
jgi:ribonuclease P protein component